MYVLFLLKENRKLEIYVYFGKYIYLYTASAKLNEAMFAGLEFKLNPSC